MDRHYTQGANEKMISDAHEQDLRLQDEYGVKFLTYWYDPARFTTFCLVEADRESTVTEVHRHAHGQIPGDIVAVDQEMVSSFLGRIADPPADGGRVGESAIEPAFRAIMFTDIVGYTSLTSRIGDVASLIYLRDHNDIVRGSLRRHAGNEVKHTGDGFMVSFVNSDNAVEAAIDIQNETRKYNSAGPEHPVHVRIGISAGEPIEEGGQFFGSSVNLASRLCDLAESDGICVSQSVADTLAAGSRNVTFSGNESVKGFDEPVPIHRITSETT